MSRIRDIVNEVCEEVATVFERREAAGLARYLQLMALIKDGKKLVSVEQLRALGYYEGEEIDIAVQMTTWQERATEVHAGGGVSYGPVQLHGGFSHKTVGGSRDYIAIQAHMHRVIRTEGMQDVLDAMPPLPPLPTDGSLTLPDPVPPTPVTPDPTGPPPAPPPTARRSRPVIHENPEPADG
jgi:hypothetical protein